MVKYTLKIGMYRLFSENMNNLKRSIMLTVNLTHNQKMILTNITDQESCEANIGLIKQLVKQIEQAKNGNSISLGVSPEKQIQHWNQKIQKYIFQLSNFAEIEIQ